MCTIPINVSPIAKCLPEMFAVAPQSPFLVLPLVARLRQVLYTELVAAVVVVDAL